MRSSRRSRRPLGMLVAIVAMLVGSASAFAGAAQSTNFTATPLSPSSQYSVSIPKNAVNTAKPALRVGPQQQRMVGVIVKLKDAPLATYEGTVPGLAATSPRITGAEAVDTQSAASKQYLAYVHAKQDAFANAAAQAVPGAKVTHNLDIIVGGVSMLVPEGQVSALTSLPNVQAVYPDQLLHLDTDRTPQFIGAPTVWQQLGGQESSGDNVIVGVLDTGIWPEHPSFSDPDPSGKAYSAPAPTSDGHTRACQFSGGANPGPAFSCNNKLIGAQRFMATYEAVVGLISGEFTTARDDDGHGTHTSSTAAGNAGVHASIFGVDRGIISGIAPRAHVIMYKVCGADGCFGSDSVAAIQQAIRDGVNVINFSISGGANPYSDSVEQAFLDAYAAGVFVAASAGNSGPGADTTDHRGPWVTTVAASTADRAFTNILTLNDGGASLSLKGTSLTAGVGPAPVVVPTTDKICANPAAPGTYTGKIVVCVRGGGPGRVQKGFNVLQGGAVGMILYNQSTAVTDLETDNHFLPVTHIQFSQGQQVLDFLAAHPGATGTLTAGVKDTQMGDVMASFSSRGGPGQSIGVSKPDITAPGVQVLAGHTPQSVDLATGPQGELFQAIAGTSMSSPHIAGSGALIKALHPNWTPGQIKSALMTTAITKVVKEDGVTPATPFDDGSGRVNLNAAGDPGFTFDVTAAEYASYATHPNDLYKANYPSVYIPSMPGIIKVSRTARDVSHFNSFYKVIVSAPSDLKITTIKELDLFGNSTSTFDITIDASNVPIGQVRFAMLTFRQLYEKTSHRELHMPITIVRKQPSVTLATSCTPASFPKNGTTDCTITMQNTTFNPASVSMTDKLPSQLKLVKGSVVGGTPDGSGVQFSGTLAAAQPPTVSLGPGSSPAGGYLPLSAFGIPPISGVGDDTVTNFNVPSFSYGGEPYTSLGVSSNGYLIVGGSSSGSDNSINNQNFPDPTPPNNVLAGFWTDLNPGAAGAIRIATLTDGVDTWIVVDWAGVREFSTAGNLHTFEIWIGISGNTTPGDDVSFAYGTNTGSGDGGFASVGVENRFGNRGSNVYYNGTGTLPSNGTQLQVTTTPGAPGGTQVVSFKAVGKSTGAWTNYAKMTSNLFDGINVASFSGTVTP